MSDDLLTALDAAFARQRVQPIAAPQTLDIDASPDAETEAEQDDADEATDIAASQDGDVWVQVFFAIQFLWGLLLFLPDAQSVRFLVRALPYLSSIGLFAIFLTRPTSVSRPAGSWPLIAALALLVLNLLHPTSQFSAGFAQCIFQFSIAAPLFWTYKAVRSVGQLQRLLVLILILNCLSAGLGVLQVYYPDRFLPLQYSSQLSDDRVASLTYRGSDGRNIVRPPGLSDTPGGAGLAGGLTALLGLGLSLRTRKLWQMLAVAAMSSVGLAVVYLTQTRSVLLMAIVAPALVGIIALRRGRVAKASLGIALGGALVVASFVWAASVGGDTISSRFLNMRDQGALSTYQQNRGHFVSQTLGEMLDEYPFGAGLGRWGMINTYFGDPVDLRSSRIYVEIQLTGWLLDGGVAMWLFYGGALFLSLWSAFRLTTVRDPGLADLAMIVLGVQVFIAGMAMAAPVFNTQLGILFWSLAGALRGATAFPDPPETDASSA